MLLTVLLNIVPILNNPVSWTAIYKYHQPLVVNMLNLTSQYYNYATYHIASMLSNGQLLTGTICYTIIFTLAAYWCFQRKHL